MPNDAMLLSVDRILVDYPKRKKMRIYAVGIAADNGGKVLVTEPPASAAINHRPKMGRPAVWDFGGDGYPIYQRTGGLADIVVAHLLLVRDRGGFREAGAIVKEVSDSGAAKNAMGLAGKALKGVTVGGLAVSEALNAVLPIASLIGNIISKKKDVVLETITGSLILSEERREMDELSQKIRSSGGNFEIEADVFLFDGVADEDTVADTKRAETRLEASHLLFAQDK